MQDFIGQATKDGPIETVYVDPSAFVTYWQNQGVDPRAASSRRSSATRRNTITRSCRASRSRHRCRALRHQDRADRGQCVFRERDAPVARGDERTRGLEFEAKMAEEQEVRHFHYVKSA